MLAVFFFFFFFFERGEWDDFQLVPVSERTGSALRTSVRSTPYGENYGVRLRGPRTYCILEVCAAGANRTSGKYFELR